MKLLASVVAIAILATSPGLRARPGADATACERNFTVDGSFLGGRTYATQADVPGATYPDALYRVRDKLVEQGLEVVAVQEKNGYIRANNAVRGGEGGSANAPLRGYVTRVDASTVNVSLQLVIHGGQSANRKVVMKYLCDAVEAASAG
ncbi:hypothetical protein L599_007000000050 [Luteimonas sp. J16]|jgi:hypothetical protein|uniref:hypothetical protein n=1 Tax=unclassified Luteimonas TaxID=2629088 RepID=UPI0004BB2813|nr:MULTISPECIES: hypothetical protein [unclassified Luteimonas]TWG86802.1 hypothetical protein L599_007000000050 [Luteimonas sp. J16]